MPLISRIRLVNFRYDNASKMFTDDVFDIAGDDCLFNLTNGGGKTVLLQLLLQVVLPTANLGPERQFVSFFDGRPDRTSHILVEWALDGPSQQFLLTGMCATKGPEAGDGCRWFMYTRRYTQKDPFDLGTFALVEPATRRPASYAELLKKLKADSGQGFNVFSQDEKRKYQKELETFGIFSGEWEAIRKINLSEGGIESFFEKCRTSRNCLDTLLIPQIEDVLSQSGNTGAADLSRIGAGYIKTMQRIPEWERQIREFTRFHAEAGEVLTYIDARGSAFARGKKNWPPFVPPVSGLPSECWASRRSASASKKPSKVSKRKAAF